jgi:hypothetical protein
MTIACRLNQNLMFDEFRRRSNIFSFVMALSFLIYSLNPSLCTGILDVEHIKIVDKIQFSKVNLPSQYHNPLLLQEMQLL